MATPVWCGGAAPVAQVNSLLFAGTWESNDIVQVKIGNKTVNVAAGSTTIATIIDNLITAWAALDDDDYPEFAEITPTRSTSTLVLTAATAGVPFTCTLQVFESDGTTPDTDATIAGVNTATSGTATTASSGPNHWDDAANWSTGVVPADSDTVTIQDSDDDILYGLNQAGIEPTLFIIKASFTGTIGLPAINAEGGYPEYRDRYLKLGSAAMRIGEGEGAGSGRIMVDFDNDNCLTSVYGSGSRAEDGIPAILIKGGSTGCTLDLNKGDVGVAIFAGEVCNLATGLKVGHLGDPSGDSKLYCGSGVTLTGTITVSGGQIVLNSAVTTLTMTDGEVWFNGSGAIATLIVDGGTFHYSSSGTLGTAVSVAGGGFLDFDQDTRGKTVTPLCNLYEGAKLRDTRGVVTWTAGYKNNRCGDKDTDVDVGPNRTHAIS